MKELKSGESINTIFNIGMPAKEAESRKGRGGTNESKVINKVSTGFS